MNIFRHVAAGCALLALTVGLPARAACWADSERDAVSVRELQTMLMVASLRCHVVGIDIVADYNGFMRAAHAEVEAASLAIKRHFAGEGGGQADYDRFVTTLANAYGADATDPSACAEAADTAHEAAGSIARLTHLATHRIFPRALPGGSCSAPARREEIATIDAPAMRPVVQLPDEVIAALAVMARYGQPAADPTPPTRIAALTH